ncbi:hypothetical protein TcasGA2_TC004668 [Tribolium castaneum]|uniref:Uncharacterized protein n=1 Tax=Tribolium castaneum TaxID=7070 RepID=D6W6A0_TRICA|nr:hypothetical protein TcasGA2_TC004668 [Tribolium castaneum]
MRTSAAQGDKTKLGLHNSAWITPQIPEFSKRTQLSKVKNHSQVCHHSPPKFNKQQQAKATRLSPNDLVISEEAPISIYQKQFQIYTHFRQKFVTSSGVTLVTYLLPTIEHKKSEFGPGNRSALVFPNQ